MDPGTQQRLLREAIAENKVLRHLCEQHGIDWQRHVRALSTLELRFRHVTERLGALWPTQAAADYLHELVFSQRPGAQGFPPDTIDELMSLLALLREFGVRPAHGQSTREAGGDHGGWRPTAGPAPAQGTQAPGESPYDYSNRAFRLR